MDCKLTIIMTCYNQEKYIEKAIDSVLQQKTNFKYKLIITDDNSIKDNSRKIIQKYAYMYSDKICPLLNDENGGYLKNVLRVMSNMKTPYFCLLDADDYYTDSNFLQRAFDFLEANEDFICYYENVECLSSDGKKAPFINSDIEHSEYDFSDYLADRIVITQTTGQLYRNVMFIDGIPKIMLDSIGTFSERSYEGDFDRFIMHLKYGKAYFNNKICGVYRFLENAGIWASLGNFDKKLLNIQALYDYNMFYEEKYAEFFLNKMYLGMCDLLDYVNTNLRSISGETLKDGVMFGLDSEKIKQLNFLYNYLFSKKNSLQIFSDKGNEMNISDVSWKILVVNLMARGKRKIMKIFMGGG